VSGTAILNVIVFWDSGLGVVFPERRVGGRTGTGMYDGMVPWAGKGEL
jgi:hypothetical protein